jgi:hypothetical protein
VCVCVCARDYVTEFAGGRVESRPVRGVRRKPQLLLRSNNGFSCVNH